MERGEGGGRIAGRPILSPSQPAFPKEFALAQALQAGFGVAAIEVFF
jgi:hypothetical protein